MAKNKLIGQTFRSAYADGMPLWKVTRSRGRGVYECTTVDEPVVIDGKSYPGDYANVMKLFTTAQVEHAVQMADHFRSLMNDHEAFYASLQAGQVVHYHDGFGQFIRCEVVELAEATRLDFDTMLAGSKVLKQVALVGAWRSYDLKADGFRAKQIREGKLMKPNASNIYENPKAEFDDKSGDPRQMPALVFEGQTDLFASV